jgi:outer membrane protein OmpA-like peptidoglycan-associated protein
LAHELTHTVQQGASVATNKIQREVTATTAPIEESAIDSSTDTCSEATEREKEAFVNHGVYGPKSMTPVDTSAGGFEAAYNPVTEILHINVRGKTRFVNGLSLNSAGEVSAYESNLRQLAILLNYLDDNNLKSTVVNDYYTWNETQKETARNNFRQRIAETIGLWETDGWISFQMTDPCWDDIFANVDISIHVQDEGEATYSRASRAANDHLQVTIVKNPERSEQENVRALVRGVVKREEGDRLMCIDSSARYTTGARVDYNRFGNSGNTDPHDSEMTLSNLSLQNTPGEENNERSLLRREIYFHRNQSELDRYDRARLNRFMTDFGESDNTRSNSRITLVGYASRLGTTAYNSQLVAARIQSVVDYLRERHFPNIETRISQINRSDTVAETQADTKDNAARFRRVDLIVGTGELQNTVAHEFGHVFGLRDEYASKGTSFSGTGTTPGTEVGHSDMAEALGDDTVLSENSDNIMSMGNEVRSQHYATFGWALHQLTHKNWRTF